MIITLTGNNSYALKARLDELIDTFVSDHGELAVERIDAEEKDPHAITEALQGSGFLSTNKLVVLRNLSRNKPAAERFEQIMSSIPESTDVVIYEPLTDKRTAFYKFLKTSTQLEEHSQLDESELAKWLVEQAKNEQVNFSFADAKYLVERVGPNQLALASELEKLILYDKSISRDSIEALVEPTPQSKIFELLDAAFSGSKDRALKLYEDQRAQKVEPQAIMAMLAWQLQIFAIVKFSGGRSPAQIAKDAGMNPYPVTKAQTAVAKIPPDRLKQMINEALDIDYQSKTSGMDLDEALKTYITTL